MELAPVPKPLAWVSLPAVVRSARVAYATLLIRRLWKFIAGYVGLYLFATFGFFLIEENSDPHALLNSFYWAMVTISTVGYGDILPTTPDAKIFTILIIATEVFLSAYLVSVVLGVVSEEAQHRALGTLGTNFSGHIVVLGYGGVGKAAVRELLVQGEKVAVVTENVDEVSNIRSLAHEKQIFVTVGPPADQEILKRVNVDSAHSVIVCSTDDTVNLVAALNVRAIAPEIRIVVSVSRPELKGTLKTAGVTYVALPPRHGRAPLRRRGLPPRYRECRRGPHRVEHGRRHDRVPADRTHPDFLPDTARDGGPRTPADRLSRHRVCTPRAGRRVPDRAQPAGYIPVPTGRRDLVDRLTRQPSSLPQVVRDPPGTLGGRASGTFTLQSHLWHRFEPD